jgi:hypothetical protein
MTERPPYVNPGELRLLDWFAGCALIGLLAKRGSVSWEESVEAALRIARDMLEARSKHVPRTEEEPTPHGWSP